MPLKCFRDWALFQQKGECIGLHLYKYAECASVYVFACAYKIIMYTFFTREKEKQCFVKRLNNRLTTIWYFFVVARNFNTCKFVSCLPFFKHPHRCSHPHIYEYVTFIALAAYNSVKNKCSTCQVLSNFYCRAT